MKIEAETNVTDLQMKFAASRYIVHYSKLHYIAVHYSTISTLQ